MVCMRKLKVRKWELCWQPDWPYAHPLAYRFLTHLQLGASVLHHIIHFQSLLFFVAAIQRSLSEWMLRATLAALCKDRAGQLAMCKLPWHMERSYEVSTAENEMKKRELLTLVTTSMQLILRPKHT